MSRPTGRGVACLSQTHDAGTPPTWPVAGSGDHATAVGLFSAIVMGLYRRERTAKGSYVTTSLLAEGVWSAGVHVAAALAGGTFYPLHDRLSPVNPFMNPYKSAEGRWFLLVRHAWQGSCARKQHRPAGLADGSAFQRSEKQSENGAQLRQILDDIFAKQPLSYWREVFDKAHITFGASSGAGGSHQRSAIGRE